MAQDVAMRLYDHLKSGNGYKVRLVLAQLGIPFERIELDIERGETRTPEFLAPEGGFDLAGFPRVREWLARVAGQPGHVPITQA